MACVRLLLECQFGYVLTVPKDHLGGGPSGRNDFAGALELVLPMDIEKSISIIELFVSIISIYIEFLATNF